MTPKQMQAWMERLRSLPPRDQTIAYWLARPASGAGAVDDIDWYRLAADSGMSDQVVRTALRDGPLLTGEHVVRTDRMIGSAQGKPAFLLSL